ncbi:Hsf-like protein [Haemophilus haemolyticus]|uniref:YadA-like family protein n=1 Tax=Haemophilus haemolyticus TaxID=726 RepID=UPI001CC6CA78|nr:YadA-like family protein [Haemophilus haemolyticus]BCL68026.1 Hsf-like protein [Haemophilus haemolyticus]
MIGNGATSKQARTVAIGNAATTLHTSAIAIGDKAYSNGARGIAIGRNAQSTGNNSIALGAGDQNDGKKTTADKDYAVAIGSDAVANIANGIALGSESKTTATSVSGQTGFDASTHDGRANHYSGLNGKTLTSNLAGLSIGNDKKTRQINHLAAGKEDDDAVNVAQLKSVNLAFKGNSGSGDVLLHDQRLSVVGAKDSFITTKASDNKLEVTATTNAVTMNKAEGKANTPTATGLTTNKAVADAINASGWKISQGTTQKDIVNPGDTVSFENGTGTTATVSNKDGKTTTVKYDVAVGKGLEVTDNKVIVKTDGDTITVGTNGELKANLSTEKVKAATGDENIATVTPKEGTENSEFGKKGATYEVAVTKSAVKKVAKTAVKVAAGDNVIVSSKDDATNNETTYTVEAVTPVVYTDKQGKRVYKVKDGNGYKFTKNADGTGEVVNKSDVIASFYDGNNSATAGTMIVNNVGSAINSTILPEGKANNFLNKLEVAASAAGTPNAAVNVSDLHNTADALRSNEWHITPTESGKPYTVKDNKVTLKYTDGHGNEVSGKTAEIDFSEFAKSINNYSFATNATSANATGSTNGKPTNTTITSGKAVNFASDDNLTLNQNVNEGNVTYTYGLNDKITIGKLSKDGKNGNDGKDGAGVVVNGQDGSIGLTGKNGENGLTIKGAQGPSGVDGKDGKDGKESTTMTRIVYETPKDAGSTETIKHEVATLDDGVKYAGDDAQPGEGQTEHQKDKVIAKKLNNIIDIIGGADKDKLSDKNIGVNNVDGKLKVQLAKELKGLTSAEFKDGDDKTKTEITHNGITITPVNPANGKTNVTLTANGLDNGGNKITNVAEGKNDTDAVNVKQLKDFKSEVTEGVLTFAGNSGDAHKAKLNSTVNIKGGEGNTDADQFDNGKNVMTKVNDNTVTVSIKKTPEVEGINIIDTTGKVKVKLTQTDEGLKVSDGNNNATRITNVKAGEKDTDAVNVKQLNAAKTEVTAGDNIDVRSSTGANGQTIYKVSANDTSAAVEAGSDHVKVTKAANTHKDGSTTVTDYTVDLSDKTKGDIGKGVKAYDKVTNEGLTFNADKGSTGVKKLGSKVSVNGDGKNITTTADENGVKVSMKDDIKVNSVTAKEVKVGDVNINENGINAGGKRITNVAPGKDGTDAVNVNQLKYVAGNISNQINNVDKGLRAGIAGALASGGLYHVTTAGKSMVSVGAGTYRGQNALAVGYSRLSDNGKVGVKFTVNSNSQGHSGASASVGYQW